MEWSMGYSGSEIQLGTLCKYPPGMESNFWVDDRWAALRIHQLPYTSQVYTLIRPSLASVNLLVWNTHLCVFIYSAAKGSRAYSFDGLPKTHTNGHPQSHLKAFCTPCWFHRILLRMVCCFFWNLWLPSRKRIHCIADFISSHFFHQPRLKEVTESCAHQTSHILLWWN